MHGAMGCTEELDPEGYLLGRCGAWAKRCPSSFRSTCMVLMERMLGHVNAHTSHLSACRLCRHRQRAAELLLRMIDEDVKPVIARAVVPALARGDELIMDTGIYGETIRRAQALGAMGLRVAGMMIGNPFTDVPELCSQAIVVTDGNQAEVEQAQAMAADFRTARRCRRCWCRSRGHCRGQDAGGHGHLCRRGRCDFVGGQRR